ncbi:hypothetical protein MAR_012300, partial [Mya arenaria]
HNCIKHLNFFTNLLGSAKIVLDGLIWFGNNRKYIHRKAKSGVSDLMKTIGIQNTLARNIPDHSVIAWNIGLKICQMSECTSHTAPGYEKFDL